MDLKEAEDNKKRWEEYTKELYKKDLNNPDNHAGVITHQETNILECEVKWGLENITTNKATEGDGIPAELFVAQMVKNLPVMWETQVRSLSQKDPLEKVTAIHSSTLA